MSEQEAQAEAERRYPAGIIGLVKYEDSDRDNERSAFREGAEWERARHVPVEGGGDTENVLAMLDDLNESGGISYDDYSRLHDAVAALGGGDQ